MYGNITAVASMLFGIVAGMRLKDGRHMESVRLGCALSLAGWILSPVIMVSKPLWTATYVLILSGCFMILLPAIGSLTDAGGSAKKWLKLPIILGSHSMLTYLVSGNIEAILSAVKVWDTNLFHYIWEHTVRFNNGSPFSCLLCSLIAIVFVCVIVCVTARVLERRESRP